MKYFIQLSLILLATCFSLAAAPLPPEAAVKYHQALLKRTDNETLYQRFINAWLDEAPLETLETFLKERAEENGGEDLALLARYQVRRESADIALITLTKAIEALPDDNSLRLERAKIYLRQLAFDAARKDLKIISKSKEDTRSGEAAKLIGKSYIKEGKPEEAIRAWDDLLASRPGDEDLLEDLLESAASDGEHKQALIYSDKLIQQTSDPYKKTLRTLRKGDLLAANNQHDEAIQTYSKTLANVGEGSWLEGEILAQIESLYTKQDRINDLQTVLSKLAEENPQRLLIHRKLAKLEAAQGETDQAIGRFREVLKRSPGERDLREEFIRLLTESERYEDAIQELETILKNSPNDAELLIQLASIHYYTENKKAIEENLNKARSIFGKDESTSLRIANLFLQYDLSAQGETILKELAAADGASPLPSQTLAAEYARTARSAEALTLLKKLANDGDLETLLRSASSINALREPSVAYEILAARAAEFPTEMRFLTSIIQTATAADKSSEVTPLAVKLVRLAERSGELDDHMGLALRTITTAKESQKWRKQLGEISDPSVAERALQAGLAELQADYGAVDSLLTEQENPLLIRFHAGILDRRGAFDEAIGVLTKLQDEDEGRKASFFKDLSELQQRAGKADAALETVTRWQQTSPGDKSAWITGIRLLEKSGKTEEAIRITRQAISRFEGDSDLPAMLASQYQMSGRTNDAVAVYWSLYDESVSPTEQVRWASQLADLAVTSGTASELEEKLRSRARSNRKSTGPILALAELARAMRDEDKRRNLLLEAMRLQPGNIDLRLQIAAIEEQSGNLDRVIAILEEPIKSDKSDRIPSALAQAYLRQGQTTKGMRVLRSIASKKGAIDPRAVEASAASLAGASLYEEAIYYIQESLPQGGDWRSNYLLALLLKQDGRESEALPIFKQLLDATGELIQPPAVESPEPFYLANYSENVKNLLILNVDIYAATAHERNQNSGRSITATNGLSFVSGFILPDTPEKARSLSLIHLAKISAANSNLKPEIDRILDSGSLRDTGFLVDYVDSMNSGRQEIANIFAKHPTAPGILELALLYNQYNNSQPLDPEILRESLLQNDDLRPELAMSAWAYLLEQKADDETAQQSFLSAFRAGISSDELNAAEEMFYHALGYFSSNSSLVLPDIVRQALGEILRNADVSKLDDPAKTRGIELAIAARLGEAPDIIAALNAENTRYRNDEKIELTPLAEMLKQQMQYMVQNQGYNLWGGGEMVSKLPELSSLNLEGLSPSIVNAFFGYAGIQDAQESNPFVKVLPLLSDVSSPSLRLWLALQADDSAAVAAATKLTPTDREEWDFLQLKAVAELGNENYKSAFESFVGARGAYLRDSNLTTLFNIHSIGIALKMDPKDSKAFADTLRPILLQLRQQVGHQSQLNYVKIAENLGLEDLVERFTPPSIKQPMGGGSQIGPAAVRSSNNSSSGSLQKLKKFISDDKIDAAAREALLVYKQAYRNNHQTSYDLEQLRQALSDDVVNALIKSVDPGSSKSLTKRIQHIDVLSDFGRTEEALVALRELHKERPSDAKVSTRLAFQLPPDDLETAIKLLTESATSSDFVVTCTEQAGRLQNTENSEPNIQFFTTVAAWLAATEAEELNNANLTWIAYYGKTYFEDGPGGDLPGLDDSLSAKQLEKQNYITYRDSLKKLIDGMLQHPAISEAGFRLLLSSRAWDLSIPEKDAALKTLLLSSSDESKLISNTDPFILTTPNQGSSSSYGDLASASSGRYLGKRLTEIDQISELFPTSFIQALREKDAKFTDRFEQITNLKQKSGIPALVQSEVFSGTNSLKYQTLRTAAVIHMSRLPKAFDLLSKEAQKIAAKDIKLNRYRSTGGADQAIIESMLRAALFARNEANLDTAVKQIGKLYLPKGVDWSATSAEAQELYQSCRMITEIAESFADESVNYLHLLSVFHKHGIPISENGNSLRNLFGEEQFQSAEEAAKQLDSLGLLDDLETWRAYPVLSMKVDYQGPGNFSLTKDEKLLNQTVSEHLRLNFSDDKLRDHLKKIKPQTFGTLVSAAALSEGRERQKLTGEAFELIRPVLAKLDSEKMLSLSYYATWLPSEAVKNLPDEFRKKTQAANSERLKEITAKADGFLASSSTNQSNREHSFREMKEVIIEILPLDLEKAVQVFLECERRFTASLGNGGTFSRYTSNQLSISQRDEAFADFLSDDESPMVTDPALALRFYQAIVASPEASRFSFSTRSSKLPLLAIIGKRIQDQNPSPKEKKRDAWLPPYKWAMTLDEDMRKTALLAVFLHQTSNNRLKNITDKHGERGRLNDMEGLDEAVRQLHSSTITVSNWNKENDANRQQTTDHLVSLLSDTNLPSITRMQLLTVVHEQPDIIRNQTITNAVAKVFTDYATTERSVVNPLGIDTVTMVNRLSDDLETLATLQSINDTFWANANAPSKGGHSPIAGESAKELFNAAAKLEDYTVARRLLNAAHSELEGDLPSISRLILSGNFDLAVALLNPTNRIYRKSRKDLPPFSATFEKRLKEFKEHENVEPLAFLRLEAQLLECPVAAESEKPSETIVEREISAAKAYRTAIPEQELLRTEILSTITRDSHLASIELREELVAHTAGLDLQRSLSEWQDRAGSYSDPAPGRLVAPAESAIFRQAAYAEWLHGNVKPLRDVAKACRMQFETKGISRVEALPQFFDRILRSSPLWIAEAIHLDKTEVFADSFEIFEDFVFITDTHLQNNFYGTRSFLAHAQFIAHWNGEPERFQKLRSELKKYKGASNTFDKPKGYFFLGDIGRLHLDWKSDGFADARRSFILASITRPEMKTYFGTSSDWVFNLGDKKDLKEDYLAIAEDMPEGYFTGSSSCSSLLQRC